MGRWIAIAFGTAVAITIALQWTEIERYRRLRSM